MSNVLLQRPLDQKLENLALEEIILHQHCSKTRLENVYTVLVKNQIISIVPVWAENEITAMKDRIREV